MATTEYAFYGLLCDIAPGGRLACAWIHPKFDYGDAVTVTAHPVRTNTLEVRNLRVSSDAGKHAIANFEIYNHGPREEVGLGIGIAWFDR